MALSTIKAIKIYFSTLEKPVTNHELIELRKADPKGFDKIGTACIEALKAQGYKDEPDQTQS